ncbi:hypothetical protein CEXT_182731 [Caerostris extrusa]|uniref:Uncharacterized protein n=1 Tax=Caerostris extrusa TaxID=172846 RepID=A0AAV4SSV7_CAEEX|nr:hypothetical protein CEXT_182731 [Caerostris extrusa]
MRPVGWPPLFFYLHIGRQQQKAIPLSPRFPPFLYSNRVRLSPEKAPVARLNATGNRGRRYRFCSIFRSGNSTTRVNVLLRCCRKLAVCSEEALELTFCDRTWCETVTRPMQRLDIRA